MKPLTEEWINKAEGDYNSLLNHCGNRCEANYVFYMHMRLNIATLVKSQIKMMHARQ